MRLLLIFMSKNKKETYRNQEIWGVAESIKTD